MDPNAVPSSSTPIIPPQDQPLPKTGNHLGSIMGIIILVFIFSLGGYFIGNTTGNKPAQPQIQAPPVTEIKQDPFFNNQTASINGEITQINGAMVSVKNSKGETRNFPLSPKLTIDTISTSGRESSSDIRLLEAGKEATIILILSDKEYQVYSILYSGGVVNFKGSIVSLDSQNLVIKTDDGTKSVTLNDNTSVHTLMTSGTSTMMEKVSRADIKVGQEVRILTSDNGANAVAITIMK